MYTFLIAKKSYYILRKFDENFNQELEEQKEEMNKIIEDFKMVLSSNKINFDTNATEIPRPEEKEKNQKSKSPAPKGDSHNTTNNNFNEREKIIVPEIKYPVSIKSLSSNQNFDPMYKEIIKKNNASSQPESKQQMSHNSSQNLSQKVNCLINENKEKKKFQTQKFISKN